MLRVSEEKYFLSSIGPEELYRERKIINSEFRCGPEYKNASNVSSRKVFCRVELKLHVFSADG